MKQKSTSNLLQPTETPGSHSLIVNVWQILPDKIPFPAFGFFHQYPTLATLSEHFKRQARFFQDNLKWAQSRHVVE